MYQVWKAISDQNIKEIRTSLKNDKSLKSLLNKKNKNGTTLIHLAASLHSKEIVLILLENGANPNIKDKERGWTACHWAGVRGNLGILKILIEHGGQLELDQEGRTPFQLFEMAWKKIELYPLNISLQEQELYTWGTGVNYQLGHGTTEDRDLPKKVTSKF